MPNLGDIKYSEELGKKVSHGKKGFRFIWWECRVCKRQYWKREFDIKRSATKGLCIRCCRKESLSKNWRGGRCRIKQGYILILLKPENPFFPMAKSGGDNDHRYIFEHRLVVAQHLGRCLRKEEIVHHLNGIRDDNRYENLALVTVKSHPKHSFVKQLQERIRGLEQLQLTL